LKKHVKNNPYINFKSFKKQGGAAPGQRPDLSGKFPRKARGGTPRGLRPPYSKQSLGKTNKKFVIF